MHHESSLTKEILSLHTNKWFVETGTNYGAGVELAISCGFKNIITIEIDPELSRAVKKRLKKKAIFLVGDSRDRINDALKLIDAPATFWLDGHSFGDVPLINELEAIAKHPIKTHTLIIDDVRMFDTGHWGNIGTDTVLSKIKEINPDYEIKYYDSINAPNDILIAWKHQGQQ